MVDFLMLLLMLTGVLVGAGLLFMLITRKSCFKPRPAERAGSEAIR
jgi:hypothetical protein